MTTKKKTVKKSPKNLKRVTSATLSAFKTESENPGPFTEPAVPESAEPDAKGGGVADPQETGAKEPVNSPKKVAQETPSKPQDSPEEKEPVKVDSKTKKKKGAEMQAKCSAFVYLLESEKIFVDRTAFEIQINNFAHRSISFGTMIRAFTQYMMDNPKLAEKELVGYVENILKDISEGKIRT